MKKIETYEQCNFIIQKFKNGRKKIFTNFFFMPKELKEVIATRNVQYQENEDALIICIEEIDFSHLYYFMLAKSVPIIEDTDKTIITDLVVRSGTTLEKITLEQEKWFAVNFKKYKQYIRLKYTLKKSDCCYINFTEQNLWRLSCAHTRDANDILDIWRTNLDKYSTPLPSVEELFQLIKLGHVYVASRDNAVIGAVYMEIALKKCTLKHLTVCANYRRQGLGTALMNYALGEMAQEGIEKCFLWVDVNNTAAYKSYKKYGFIEEGLRSIQLMRMPN